MKGSRTPLVVQEDRARILSLNKRKLSLLGGGQGARIRSLTIALAMALVMLGSMYAALPTTQHHLSPVGPTHASNHDGSAGEGPFSTPRASNGRRAYLDILPVEPRFCGRSGEAVNVTFNLTERNNVGLTLSSISWKLKTLDGASVVDGTGTSPCPIDLGGLGSTEWKASIAISSQLYRDMMVQGRDQLRLIVTFHGTDANSNPISSSWTVPAHLTQRVAILVDKDVFPLIEDNLKRYEVDANLRGSAEFIYKTGNWGNAETIRSLIQQLWRDEGINGVMLWGYLPFAMWDFVHADDSHEIFPIPVFYEDLDGEFIDDNSDGLYDRHIWGENDGCEVWTAFVMPPRRLVPSENLDPRGQGTGGGLRADYYDKRNFGEWKLTRVDPTLDFYWDLDLPSEITDDDFSVRWTGRIRADMDECYTLSSLNGGRMGVWIDGKSVLDDTGNTWAVWEHLNSIYLTKGWHDIRIEYNNNNWGFNGATRLLWTSDAILADTINEWLDRSHAFHHDELEYNERALLFMDYGYGIKCRMRDPILARQIKPLYGDNVIVAGCTNTTAGDDYIEALVDGHELVSVWSHAGSAGHWIAYEGKPPEVNGTAPTHKIRETQAGLVTLIWGCHAGDFGDRGEGTSLLSDNLAANYAFSTPYGLACGASTRSIGSTFREVYWAWQNHSSMATGMFAYLDFGYDKALRERQWPAGGTDRWVEDVVFFGDPFIRIDHRPWNLTLEIDGDSGYTSDSNVTLSVSAIEADEMRFKNNGGQWSPWEDFCATKVWVIGQAFGTHRVSAQVRNGWGSADYTAAEVITRVTTMSDRVGIEVEDGAEMTNTTLVQVSLDIGDGDPSMVMMSLKDDGSDWSDLVPFVDTTSFRLSPGDGERTVSARFVSDDGIWRMETSDTIVVDSRAPMSSYELTGELGIGGWYVSPIVLALNATDGVTGVDGTECSLDGADWSQYTEALEVSDDGHHELRYRSIDKCGNVEPTRLVRFKMDTTCPAGLVIETANGNSWLNLPALELALNAEDTHSGMDVMRFSIDGGEWTNWINFETDWLMTIPSEEGPHTIEWQVRDLAGNVADAPMPLTVVMDSTSPGVNVTFPEDGSIDIPVDISIAVTFDETIDPSTIDEVNLLVQNEMGVPMAGDISYDEATGTVTYSPVDHLGHYTTYTVLLRGGITDLAGNGLNGGAGHIRSFTTVGLAPGPPTGVRAEATKDSIEVEWDPPSEPGSGDFLGYNIYRMRQDGTQGQEFEFLAMVKGTWCEDRDVEDSVQYHYMVRSLTSYAEGTDSQVASAVIVPAVEGPEEPEDPNPPAPNNEEDPGDMGAAGMTAGKYALIVIVVVIVSFIGVVIYIRQGGEAS